MNSQPLLHPHSPPPKPPQLLHKKIHIQHHNVLLQPQRLRAERMRQHLPILPMAHRIPYIRNPRLDPRGLIPVAFEKRPAVFGGVPVNGFVRLDLAEAELVGGYADDGAWESLGGRRGKEEEKILPYFWWRAATSKG